MTLSKPARYDIAGEFWSDRSLSPTDVATLSETKKWLYSVWDDPARAHDHAPRRSEGWPEVVCKEGSD